VGTCCLTLRKTQSILFGMQSKDKEEDKPQIGQIVRLYADVATVRVDGQDVQCAIRGKLFSADPPAVGDRVKIEKPKGSYVITEVLPRKSALARRAAGTDTRKQVLIANVDQVMVVFAAANPEPNLARLDRFLVVVEVNELEAQIVINKIDLVDRQEVEAMFEPYVKAGYPVHYTSARTGEGLEELHDALRGKESVFVGPSGVGKSSLLNVLYPGLNLKVGRVSEAYGKGRHTTVGGVLVKLPDGASVADTAGLREIGLWMTPPEELPQAFPEFEPYLGKCRFNNCAHVAEPGCAVREAVERGEIDAGRYESYTKLRAEAVETFPRW
jgi:ribosome biogenesis GTPase